MSRINLRFVISVALFFAAGFITSLSFFDTDAIHLLYITLAFVLFLLSALSVQRKFFEKLTPVLKERTKLVSYFAYESTICMAAWVPLLFMLGVYEGKLDGILWLLFLLILNAYIGYTLLFLWVFFLGLTLRKRDKSALPPGIYMNLVLFLIYLLIIDLPVVGFFFLSGGGIGMIGW